MAQAFSTLVYKRCERKSCSLVGQLGLVRGWGGVGWGSKVGVRGSGVTCDDNSNVAALGRKKKTTGKEKGASGLGPDPNIVWNEVQFQLKSLAVSWGNN